MIASLRLTSSLADVAVYIDDDQGGEYDAVNDCLKVLGPRVGQCYSLNDLVRRFPGYRAYGSMTDDALFVTPDWDRWVLEQVNQLKGGVGAISPFCEMEDRMDFPWLTAGWIQAIGEYCPMLTTHYYWDVALELLAEQFGAIAYAGPAEFAIRHNKLGWDDERSAANIEGFGPKSGLEVQDFYVNVDARNAMVWLTNHRREAIRKLRAARGDSK